MGRNLYTTGARALFLVLAPLCCHAFLPANSIARGGQIRSRHHVPIMSTFGGIQHAGVLVKNTKASKASHQLRSSHYIALLSLSYLQLVGFMKHVGSEGLRKFSESPGAVVFRSLLRAADGRPGLVCLQ